VPNFRKAAREGRYKTIRAPNIAGTNKVEFYDLTADPFETVDLYDDLQPALTAEQQAAFDDIQLFFDYLGGLIATCPATRSCREPLACESSGFAPRLAPAPVPACTFTDTGETVCGAPGLVFECPPGKTVHLRKCTCRITPIPAPCLNLELTLVCL
jgi:hypothetical protein